MKPNSIQQNQLWSEDRWSGHYAHVTFYQCYWQDMVFDDTRFSHCTFYHCHWGNCIFFNTQWQRVMVYHGDMNAMTFEENQLHNTMFQDTAWQKIRIINSTCLGVGFHHTNLRNSGLEMLHCTECLFDQCDMETCDAILQRQNRLTVLPLQTKPAIDPFLSQQQQWEQQHGLSV